MIEGSEALAQTFSDLEKRIENLGVCL